MKKIALLFIGLMIFTSVQSQRKDNKTPVKGKLAVNSKTKTVKKEVANPYFKFAEETIDYGDIYKEDKEETGVRKFEFTNIGDKPIYVARIKTSCGCTTPKYSKEPVFPGESGYIDVRYRAKNPGRFTKSLTVFYNHTGDIKKPADNKSLKLKIKGEVFAGEKEI